MSTTPSRKKSVNYQKIETLVKQYTKLSKGVFDVNKYTGYSMTYHSTAIEGSSLTESQVIELLENDIPAKNRPFVHHLMVIDHHNALTYMMQEATQKNIFNESLIKAIASRVMKNTGSVINTISGSFDSSNGDYRLCSVRAGTRTFPDYRKVPDEVKTLCRETQKKMDKVSTFREKCELAFHVHFSFVSIHPFADGNGRTSRLLMNYILAYYKLPMFFVFRNNRISYVNALEEARKEDDEASFYRFMFGQYEKFLNSEIKNF